MPLLVYLTIVEGTLQHTLENMHALQCTTLIFGTWYNSNMLVFIVLSGAPRELVIPTMLTYNIIL
jgi:hypothetical protein